MGFLVLNLLVFLLALMPLPHEHHFTHTAIQYDKPSQNFQITLKISAHDIEKAVKKKNGPDLNLGTDREQQKADSFVNAYIKKHLQFKVNGKQKPYHFLGNELDENYHDLWCYMAIKNVGPVENLKSLRVKNTLFVSLYNDQNNLVTLELTEGNHYRLHLSPDKTVQKIALKKVKNNR